MIAPKPPARARKVSLWRYMRLFRQDILSAQPDHLYSAKMAEFRTPFFRSFLINEPDLVAKVLKARPQDFPKSGRVTAGLKRLLGQSVFVTNGDTWKRQRRIIDPAFERGKVKDSFPAMQAAAQAMADRIAPGMLDVEEMASHATADVIFRTLFSIPIEDALATETYNAFRAFQRSQPVLTPAALVPGLPAWHRRAPRDAAKRLRGMIEGLVTARMADIQAGHAPDDLATRIMTTPDPETGETFTTEDMTDQVAIFFLAGHETSAALLGWALWVLAAAPEWGAKVREEAQTFAAAPDFAALSKMPATRNVLRETLRLYPPVPMMVRETARATTFRKRSVPVGAQVVISPWHMGRAPRLWSDPDAFDPARWEDAELNKDGYLPFSAGPRVCPGAGFAMAEATVLLAALMAKFRFEAADEPVPVAHLTVRSKAGIRLRVSQGSLKEP